MAVAIEELTQVGQLGDELAELAARVQRSVVIVRGHRSGGGAGVVWNDRGLVITNHHVVPGDRAEISWGRGSSLPARVVVSSASLDIAALQVEGDVDDPRLVPAVVRDSSTLRTGELVVAVGNPLGERNAVTLGMISAVGNFAGRHGNQREVIQAAITVRPGNSGGALADVHGRVVGIPNIMSGPGSALAVPSRSVERLLLSERGGRAFFGLGGQWVTVPSHLVERYELPNDVGMLLSEVVQNSPAESAGLTLGDLVVGVGNPSHGQAGSGDLPTELSLSPVGQLTHLAVIRAGELRTFEVTPRAA
jgi:serine protease Do